MSDLEERIAASEARRDWPQLEALCRQGLQNDPDDWSLWQRLGRSLEERQEWNQAETLWRHLTQRFAERPDPFLALAALQRRRGSPASARIVIEQARQQLGEHPELVRSQSFIDDPWLIDGRSAGLTRQSPATEVAATLQAAREHLEAGRAPEAEAAFRQLVAARPEALPFHRSLAALRRRRGSHDLLIEQLAPLFALPLDPLRLDPPDLAHALVDALLNLERWEAIEPLLAELRRHLPEDYFLVCAHARALLTREADSEALSLLRQVVAQRPEDAAALALLAEALTRIGDQAGAIAAYEQALATDPHQLGIASALEDARRSLLWSQGEEALGQARWGEAAQAYRHLRDRHPDDPRALARLELLDSLQPRQWSGRVAADHGRHEGSDEGSDEPLGGPRRRRLAEFAAALDRLEARIEAQIDPLS